MQITPRENMLRVYRHQIPDYLPLGSDNQTIRTVEPGFKAVVYEGKAASENEEICWFGQNWKYEKMVRAFNPDARNYIVKDIVHWRDYVTIPDLDAIDWKARFDADNIKIDRQNKLILVKDTYGLWERAFSMNEITELLCALLIEPEACADFFSAVADHKIKLHNYYIDYYKPDVLCMHDDYGGGNSMFMSPEIWRALIKPSLQRVIDNVTSKGVMYEHHCCGLMAPIAEEIAEMGASSWQNVHVVNDPYACKQKFGDKIALVGGMCDGQFMDYDDTTEDRKSTRLNSSH